MNPADLSMQSNGNDLNTSAAAGAKSGIISDIDSLKQSGKNNPLIIKYFPDSIQIHQGNQKDKVKTNLANIIEKAVSMR